MPGPFLVQPPATKCSAFGWVAALAEWKKCAGEDAIIDGE